jgi:hypothetical protein
LRSRLSQAEVRARLQSADAANLRRMLGNAEFASYLASRNALRYALANEAMLRAMLSAELRTALRANWFAQALRSPVLLRALADPGVAQALRTPAMLRAFAEPGFAKAVRSAEFASAISAAELRNR